MYLVFYCLRIYNDLLLFLFVLVSKPATPKRSTVQQPFVGHSAIWNVSLGIQQRRRTGTNCTNRKEKVQTLVWQKWVRQLQTIV